MLKGINLGSWLNPEGYILGGRNIAYHKFEKSFVDVHGENELEQFNSFFIENYITENDFARISKWKADIIRIPFHYKRIESSPYKYNSPALKKLDWAFDMAEKYNLKIVLDLHAACGAQSSDWHADSDGTPHLWDNGEFLKRTYALWSFLAERYKDKPALYAYDVLNEPALYERPLEVLINFYENVIKTIREKDSKTLIYLEGHNWSQDIDFLAPFMKENVGVSIHFYQPFNFTFNFRRGYSYPGRIEGELWDKDKIKEALKKYADFRDKHSCQLLVGELGINYRGNSNGEVDYLNELLQSFEEYDFNWTYWTYKCVAQSGFPDGVMQYNHNPVWIRREGPVYGIENIPSLWKEHKNEIIKSWRSEEFHENYSISKLLNKYYKLIF